jgi:hypothetical protein
MKIMTATFLICASTLTIHFALGASSGGRPAAVEERNWIPVSDKMGFVVTSSHPFPPPTVMLAPPAEGYFMVRTGNGWQRLVIVEPVKGPGATG